MPTPALKPATIDQLRDARLAHGHTQRQAADMIGCSLRSLVAWEQGDAAPHAMWHHVVLNYVRSARLQETI